MEKSFCLMIWAAAKDPNIFLKMTNMAGGPSQLADMAFATFVRQWVAMHLKHVCNRNVYTGVINFWKS